MTDKKIKEPTREDVKSAMKWVAERTNLVPVLHGPTASGKTYLAHQWANEIGGELITCLLSQHTPDEVAGFQTEINGELVAQMPYWFRRAQQVIDDGRIPIIFFDELGLAREEVRGAVYTFMRDREIHGNKLNGTAYVVAAMNPATLAPPFMSRAVMLNVPADRAYLISIAKHPMARKAAEAGTISNENDPAYSNQSAPRPETVHAAAIDALNQLDRDFWQMEEPAQRLVLQGLVPPATLEELMRDQLDVSVLAKKPAAFREAAAGMDPADFLNIVESILETLPSLTPRQRALILFEIQDACYDDVDNRLEPYHSKARSEVIQQAAIGMDVEAFWKRVEDTGFISAENDELKGTAIDRWIAQRGEPTA